MIHFLRRTVLVVLLPAMLLAQPAAPSPAAAAAVVVYESGGWHAIEAGAVPRLVLYEAGRLIVDQLSACSLLPRYTGRKPTPIPSECLRYERPWTSSGPRLRR